MGNNLQQLHADLVNISPGLLGDNFQEALLCIRKHLDIEIIEAFSGQKIGTWEVPKAWKFIKAQIQRSDGLIIISSTENPFIVWQHSVPTNCNVDTETLLKHVVVSRIDGARDVRVSYYSPDWGFCLTSEELSEIKNGFTYDICIESCFYDHPLQAGVFELKGESEETLLIDSVLSFHSLANNLSGVVAAVLFALSLKEKSTRHFSYIFTFTPETIGSVLLASQNPNFWANVTAGLNVMGLGDSERIIYKKSPNGNTLLDKAFQGLSEFQTNITVIPYSVEVGTTCNEKSLNASSRGGIIGRVSSTIPGSNPRYDTTLDSMSSFDQSAMDANIKTLKNLFKALDMSRHYHSVVLAEPFLSGLGMSYIFKDDKMRNLVDGVIAYANHSDLFFKFLMRNMEEEFRLTNVIADLTQVNIIASGHRSSFLTERTFCRTLQQSDASTQYLDWMRDKEVTEYLETPEIDIKALENYIQEKDQAPDAMLFGIFNRSTLAHIGNVKLEPIDDDKATMGILIGDKKSWNKGFASEVLQGLSVFAKNTLQLKKIELGVLIRNKPAIKCYTNVGFEIIEKRMINRPKLNIEEAEYWMALSLHDIQP